MQNPWKELSVKEWWLWSISMLIVTVSNLVGGSFDVFAGAVKRAPKLFQDAHLEWFYRLLKEPSRIGQMMVLPKFVVEVKKSKKQDQ